MKSKNLQNEAVFAMADLHRGIRRELEHQAEISKRETLGEEVEVLAQEEFGKAKSEAVALIEEIQKDLESLQGEGVESPLNTLGGVRITFTKDVVDAVESAKEKLFSLIGIIRKKLYKTERDLAREALLAKYREPEEGFLPETWVRNSKNLREDGFQEVDDFKRAIAYQEEGIAMLQTDILVLMHNLRDMTPAERSNRAKKLLEDYKDKLALNPRQLELFTVAIERFEACLSKTEELVDKFPDPRDLYEYLLGTPPVGKVEVLLGAISLMVRCYDERDYERFFIQGIDSSDSKKIEHKVSRARKSVGVHPALGRHPDISGLVNAQRVMRGMTEGDLFDTLIHEDQHTLNQLAQSIISFTEKPIPLEKDLSNATEWPRSQLRWTRENFEVQAADEILAYFSHKKSAGDIRRILLRSEAEGGSYDYASGWAEKYIPVMKQTMPEEKANELAHKILVEDYQKNLLAAVDAFNRLRSLGWKIDDCISFFSTKPLKSWGKWVKRIQEAKVEH